MKKIKYKKSFLDMLFGKCSTMILLFPVIIFAFTTGCSGKIQIESEHRFEFDGFLTIINDFARDEDGNYMFLAEVTPTDLEKSKRDTTISRIYDEYHDLMSKSMDINIVTDKDYNVLKVRNSYKGVQVQYNKDKKLFIIGANYFSSLHGSDKNSRGWNPVIMERNLNLKGKIYFLEKPYSTYLQEFVSGNNNDLLLFTKCSPNQDSKLFPNQRLEIIKVQTTNTYTDSLQPWQTFLEPMGNFLTPHNDNGRISLSDISKVENAYYLVTSNLNQSELKNKHRLYRFKNHKLTEITKFPEYIMVGMIGSDWVNINGFKINADKSMSLLVHNATSEEEMIYMHTNEYFQTYLKTSIPLNYYADGNTMHVLDNGKIMILKANESDNWAYCFYDSKMNLVEEIDSGVSKEYGIRKNKLPRGKPARY